MKDIALFGAGGFGREVACLINMINEVTPTWNLIGFFDDGKPIGEDVAYGKVLGGMEELNKWETELAVAIPVATPQTLNTIINKITNPLISFPNLIAPDVVFFDKKNTTMGKGNIIASRCLFSTNVALGDFNLFNCGVLVGHDTILGNSNVIMSSVNISGGIVIGDCNFLGVQSVLLQYIKVGNNTRIGANSVVIRNTKDGYLYMGNPAIKMNY